MSRKALTPVAAAAATVKMGTSSTEGISAACTSVALRRLERTRKVEPASDD